DSIAAPELKAVLNGAGHIDLRGVNADAVSATLGGAGIIALEGEARRASAVLNGAGTIDLQGLRTDLAPDCSVSGVGKILQKAK
ncbi:MAG: GIN domain-containing protein, partial [Bacteroidales bacterium]